VYRLRHVRGRRPRAAGRSDAADWRRPAVPRRADRGHDRGHRLQHGHRAAAAGNERRRGEPDRRRSLGPGDPRTAGGGGDAHHVGAPRALDLAYIRRQAAAFSRHRLAIVGYFGLLPGLEPALADALDIIKAAGCRVAVETGGSGGTLASLAPALPLVDYYVPSLDEARHQTALDDPREIVACYRSHGAAGLVSVKLGARGVLLSPAAGEFVEIPCIPAPGPVADTTGAGDAFLAGLFTGILRDMPIRDAGLLGAATAACCVTGLGATAGLRSFADTRRLAGL